MPDPDSSVILFDEKGRPYRFASEEEIRPHRLDARTFAGLALQRATAPPEALAGTDAAAEIGGRHIGAESEFYHTDWEYGRLRFHGQDGFVGEYYCLHAHASPEDARAWYDPSGDMIPASADAMRLEAGETAAR